MMTISMSFENEVERLIPGLPDEIIENEVERLIPGLPDEITVDHIVPKLSWGEVHILSSVNRRWREAKQRREIYDARVRSHSSDTFVMINHTVNEGDVVLLYSVRDNSSYQLPQFPKSQNSQIGISCYKCISLDGKIYVLGGLKVYPYIECSLNDDSDNDRNECYGLEPCSEVYVLDLAGRNEWKQCADMPQPRSSFGCGVMHGKIYVFGGRTSGGQYILQSWVYDPSENSWCSIKSMQEIRSHPQVLAVGERLFVHGGRYEVPDGGAFNHFAFQAQWYRGLSYDIGTEVYHPGKNKWTVGLHSPSKDEWALLNWRQQRGRLFTAEGKLHMITPIAIYRHGIDRDGDFAWTLLHTFEEVSFANKHAREYDVCATQFVNGELLALTWSDPTYQVGRYVTARGGLRVLLRNLGFGSDKEKISWEKIPCGIVEKHWSPHFMCTIEL